MSVSEESGAKAKKESTEAMEFEVASYLKRSWNVIRLAATQEGKKLPEDPTSDIVIEKIAKDPTKPTEAELEELARQKEERWKKMARQLIDERQLTADNVTISIAELDRQLDESTKKSLNIDSLEKLIPTRKQIGLVSSTIGSSVAKNTGTGIGFLDSLFGGATFGAAFRGLFTWIFSGFKGGFTGLKEIIAGNVGDNIKTSATDDLKALRDRLRGTPDDISGFLNNTAITAVGEKLGRVPLESLKPSGVKPPQLRDVKVGDIEEAMRDTVRLKMNDTLSFEIGDAFRKQDRFKDAYANEKKDKSWWDSAKDLASQGRTLVGLPGEGVRQRRILDRVQNGVSARLSQIMTAKDYRYQGDEPALVKLKTKKLSEMSAEDRALVIAAEARQAIKELGASDPDNRDDSLYSVIALTLPDEVGKSILQKDKEGRMPWLVSGNIELKVARVTAPDAKLDDTTLIGKAAPEIQKILSETLAKELAPDTKNGKQVKQLVGKALEKKHFDAIGGSLAPVVLVMNTTDRQKLIDMKGEAYAEASKRFREALKDEKNKKLINDGITISDEALDVMADQMAMKFVKDELKITDPVPPEFETQRLARETLAKKGAVGNVLEMALRDQKEMLEQTLKPGAKLEDDPKSPSTSTFRLLTKAIEPVITARVGTYITDPEAYEALSNDIFSALKKDPKIEALYNDDVLRVMADEMATTYIQSQDLGVDEWGFEIENPAIPEKFAGEMKARKMAATEKVVFAGINDELTLMAPQIVAANDNKPFDKDNIAAAASAVKGVVAARVGDDKALKAMTDDQYRQFVADIRTKLKENRADIGIPDDNDLLIDMMSIKIASGALEKKMGKDKAPKMPADMANELSAAEVTLVTRAVSNKLEKELTPSSEGGRQVKQLVGKPLEKKHFDAIAASLAPAIVVMNGDDKKKLTDMKGGAYAEVAERFRKALKEEQNKAKINNGITINDQAIDVLADQMAVKFVQDELKIKDEVPEAFKNEMLTRELEAKRGPVTAGLEKALREQRATLEQTLKPGAKLADDPKNPQASSFMLLAKAIEPVITPRLGKPITDPAAYEQLSGEVFTALKKDANAQALYSEETLRIMADQMATKFIQSPDNASGRYQITSPLIPNAAPSEQQIAAGLESKLFYTVRDKITGQSVAMHGRFENDAPDSKFIVTGYEVVGEPGKAGKYVAFKAGDEQPITLTSTADTAKLFEGISTREGFKENAHLRFQLMSVPIPNTTPNEKQLRVLSKDDSQYLFAVKDNKTVKTITLHGKYEGGGTSGKFVVNGYEVMGTPGEPGEYRKMPKPVAITPSNKLDYTTLLNDIGVAEKFTDGTLVAPAVPAKFFDEMKARKAVVTQKLVYDGLVIELTKMSPEIAKANNDQPFDASKITAAANAVKAVVAERVGDDDVLKNMTAEQYRKFVADIRTSLKEKRSELGIPVANDVLIDMMAIKIATGSIEAKMGKGQGPQLPPDLKQELDEAEATIVRRIMPRELANKKTALKQEGIAGLRDFILGEINGTIGAPAGADGFYTASQMMNQDKYLKSLPDWVQRQYHDASPDSAIKLAQAGGKAPNEAQIDRMSEIMAEAVLEVTSTKKFATKEEYQAAVKQAIMDKFSTRRGEINNRPLVNQPVGLRAGNLHPSISWGEMADDVVERKGYFLGTAEVAKFAEIAAAKAAQRFESDVKPTYVYLDKLALADNGDPELKAARKRVPELIQAMATQNSQLQTQMQAYKSLVGLDADEEIELIFQENSKLTELRQQLAALEETYKDKPEDLVGMSKMLAAKGQIIEQKRNVLSVLVGEIKNMKQVEGTDVRIQQITGSIDSQRPPLEAHIKGNPQDAIVKAIVALKAAIPKQEEEYNQRVTAMKTEYDNAKALLRTPPVSTDPQDAQKRAEASKVIGTYQKRMATEKAAYLQQKLASYVALKAEADKLPDMNKASPAVLQAYDAIKSEKYDKPEVKAAFKANFQKQLQELQVMDPKETAIRFKIYRDELKGKDDSDKDIRSITSPVLPENIAEKAKYAGMDMIEVLKLYPALAAIKPELKAAVPVDALKFEATAESTTYLGWMDKQKVFQKPDKKLMVLSEFPNTPPSELQRLLNEVHFERDDNGGLSAKGEKTFLAVAAGLKKRIEDKETSAENRAKFTFYLKDIKAFATEMAGKDPKWKDVIAQMPEVDEKFLTRQTDWSPAILEVLNGTTVNPTTLAAATLPAGGIKL